MRTTILLFHPDYDRSRANRALAEAAAELAGVEVIDMHSLYPNGVVNVDAEVETLLGAERLVLQFPVQWYSTPPLLKAWQDSVLTRMYYVRPDVEGERLRDLPVMVAATAGNEPAAYTAEGVNLFPLADLLHPLRATANRCFWRWRDPFLLYRANKMSSEELRQSASDYLACLTQWR